jgi:hypothetical protein
MAISSDPITSERRIQATSHPSCSEDRSQSFERFRASRPLVDVLRDLVCRRRCAEVGGQRIGGERVGSTTAPAPISRAASDSATSKCIRTISETAHVMTDRRERLIKHAGQFDRTALAALGHELEHAPAQRVRQAFDELLVDRVRRFDATSHRNSACRDAAGLRADGAPRRARRAGPLVTGPSGSPRRARSGTPPARCSRRRHLLPPSTAEARGQPAKRFPGRPATPGERAKTAPARDSLASCPGVSRCRAVVM